MPFEREPLLFRQIRWYQLRGDSDAHACEAKPTLREIAAIIVLHPQLAVEGAVLNSFGNVLGLDVLLPIQVGDRA